MRTQVPIAVRVGYAALLCRVRGRGHNECIDGAAGRSDVSGPGQGNQVNVVLEIDASTVRSPIPRIPE